MPSKLLVSKLADFFVGFVRVDQQSPPWASSLPLQRHDRIIGFVEGSSDGQAFVLAEEAVFLEEGGTWIRIPYSEITDIHGEKSDVFWDTVITISLGCTRSVDYRGRNSFGLWSCIQRLNDAREARIELSLPPKLSSALKELSKRSKRHRNDIVYEWVEERLKSIYSDL